MLTYKLVLQDTVVLILCLAFYLTAETIKLMSNDNAPNINHNQVKFSLKLCEIRDPHFDDKKTLILWDLALYNFRGTYKYFTETFRLFLQSEKIAMFGRKFYVFFPNGKNRSLQNF